MTTTPTPNDRRYSRIPCGGVPCVVESDGHEAECVLLDESIGGYRIKGIDPMFLPRHQRMRLVHRDEVIEVVCTNVSRDDGKEFTIGLQRYETSVATVCDDDFGTANPFAKKTDPETCPQKSPEVEGTLIKPFVCLRDQVGIGCEILEIRDQGKVLVEIFGQKQFEVSISAVRSLCRGERHAELLQETDVAWLASVYSHGQETAIAATVDVILDHEFGAAV